MHYAQKWDVWGAGQAGAERPSYLLYSVLHVHDHKWTQRGAATEAKKNCLLKFILVLDCSSESLQHCITPQSSVTSLYGRFRAQCLPCKEGTEV